MVIPLILNECDLYYQESRVFFCKRAKPVPSSEENLSKAGRPLWETSAKAGTWKEAARMKKAEAQENRMSKEISDVVWLVTLRNIKNTQKILFGLNVDKKLGQMKDFAVWFKI